jgi:uncharacterized protein (DUF2237 family)
MVMNMRERVSVLLSVIQCIVVAVTTCILAPNAMGQQCEHPSEESRMDKEERTESKNVLGQPLQQCGCNPMTGFYRDGFCQTGARDVGSHTVCAVITEEFLAFTKKRGNDLSTPAPHFNFPGLKSGDRWCLCVSRWKEAYDAGVAPPVILEATHERALRVASINELRGSGVQ